MSDVTVFRHCIEVNRKAEIFRQIGDPIQITETARRIYVEIFDQLKESQDWKLPTRRIIVRSRTEAHLIAEALTFNLGGAEIEAFPLGGFKVGSKGYKHYMENS